MTLLYKSPPEEMEDFQKADSNHEISVWIDCYDDIFSNFDLRPYTARNISDDFLVEVKKLTHECDYPIQQLNLLIPGKDRNAESENTISKRLHSHFFKNLHYFLKKKKNERKKDILFTVIGLSMMICAAYVSSSGSTNNLLRILLVVFEPAGWFLVWISMEHLINTNRKEKPELEFYTKMSKSKINFSNS